MKTKEEIEILRVDAVAGDALAFRYTFPIIRYRNMDIKLSN